ncbi:hypothetical protein ACFS4T_33945 [Pseudomonas lini]
MNSQKASVSKENFAGEDVRFSSEYEALESELGKASSMHESGQIDWLKNPRKQRKTCCAHNPRICVLARG